jgi:hypothetical protein
MLYFFNFAPSRALHCRLYVVHHPRIAPSDIVVMARSDALPLSGAASFVAPLEPRRNSYTLPLLPPGMRLVKRGCFATRALPISNRFMVDVDYAAANASAWRSIIAFENRSLSLREAEFALRSRALPHALASLRAQRVRHTSSMQPRID